MPLFTFATIDELQRQLTPYSWKPEDERGGILVGGEGEEGQTIVSAAIAIPNIAEKPAEEYRPEMEMVAARLTAVERGGFSLVGTYHTHPHGSAVLSRGDSALLEHVDLLLLVANPSKAEPACWEWRAWNREGELYLAIAPPHIDI